MDVIAGVNVALIDDQCPQVIPPHLREHEFNDWNDIEGALSTVVELERKAIWAKADICATARLMYPMKDHGAPNPDGRKLVSRLAHICGVTGQTVRRWIKLGLNFPPTVQIAPGQEIDLRVYSRPIELYEIALRAPYPVAAVLEALDERNNWSPDQLRKHLAGQPVTSWSELFDYTWGPDEMTYDRIVGYVATALEEALQAKANMSNARLLWVRFRAEAMYEPEQPEAT